MHIYLFGYILNKTTEDFLNYKLISFCLSIRYANFLYETYSQFKKKKI